MGARLPCINQHTGMAMTQPDLKTRIKPNLEVKEPSMFRVIYINDEQTSMEFVIDSLMDHFDYSEVQAHDMTLSIHQEGSAVVAVLPYEIAEQKGIEITVKARGEGYPLQIKLEPVDQ
jgi:ATP-dependent Clp protease adaptor protein ClpS